MKQLISIVTVVVFILCLSSYCWSENYTVQSIGGFDYVNGSNGYFGTGQQIGDFYFYGDNE